MSKKTIKPPRKLNKNLKEVAGLTGFSYVYVRQVAAGQRANTLIERAIIAFDEQDFAALKMIKDEIIEQSKAAQ